MLGDGERGGWRTRVRRTRPTGSHLPPGLDHRLFDVSATIPPDSWYGTLLKGVFKLTFQPKPSVLQAATWSLCLVPTLVLFLRLVQLARAAASAPVA